MNRKQSFDFEAVVFDLDGVITKTAITHTAAWKKMFDDYLRTREKEHNEQFREFTQADYLAYVDGKPRYNGVASFLQSREISLPWGTPEDSTDAETVCGLGNRKNEAFNEVLKRDGAEVYPSSKQLLLDLQAAGVKLGVASSSKNCKAVLEAVNLLNVFGTRVDGIVSAELGLKGKPEPDIFTTACKNLDAKPENSIVVEDAVSGVQAGSKGGFGLTLGIAREANAYELQKNGADYVVTDLEEVNGVDGLNNLFLKFRKS
ncbi:haloacid dehalogenase superfamily, subfamily IA, variant 3 with third motif having DD or ED/beta-phosphoglucomutase family hydrolase [Mariniphaga anaerophila]|uniref:Haloacid dehalogenase superfamily, subfamily IA, variant 3 with third motif having DD or ED/beta-phosphoglucomutase family hydrolase n=1 Tax=Mariniphaga anaerophila TaxID=1484053 RepID=A0A1M4YPQ9_9BACT|nr:beta-phosphoglucomutase family hydrolase [Mariniphaga anaerophila]SHF07805.1 haloacid dehalogenase superfamily, subfamily IA, variant 3 with third motif having DD or ED/beta-phosphoglucomutase family hydrolase [Mariniphaga anaerophila]